VQAKDAELTSRDRHSGPLPSPQAGYARDVHCRGDHSAGVRVCSGTFVVVQEIGDAGEVLDDAQGLVLACGAFAPQFTTS
jgi:hypothetical protein